MGQPPARGIFLNIITFYADCDLPDIAAEKQKGFDWRAAIKMLEKSAARQGYKTLVVTDQNTEIDSPWLRVGDAKAETLMHWLLNAQVAAMAASDSPAVMVSPDTLLSRPIDFLVQDGDVTLLTRDRPKPIVNSVIGFRPSDAVTELWSDIASLSYRLPDDSKEWGADIDAVVKRLRIQFKEHGNRRIDGVNVRLIPVDGVFKSVKPRQQPHKIGVPIWDFKGARKAVMQDYARLIRADL